MKSSSSTASSPAEHTADETEVAAQSLPCEHEAFNRRQNLERGTKFLVDAIEDSTELDEYSDVSPTPRNLRPDDANQSSHDQQDSLSAVSVASETKIKRSSGQTVALGRYVHLNDWYSVCNKAGAQIRGGKVLPVPPYLRLINASLC